MELGKGCRKLSPGPWSHENICRRSLVFVAGVDEKSRFRHDVQCVYIDGEGENNARVEGVRGGMLKPKERAAFSFPLLPGHHDSM